MRPSQSLSTLALCLSAAAPLAAAWPTWFPELDLFVVRRADASSTSSPPASQTSAPQPPKSSSSPPQTSVNLNTASVATDSAGKVIISTPTDGSGTQPIHTDFSPVDPAGGVVMITPAITMGTQLYRIGEYVTWAWNYTNLQANPTAVDVVVSCPKATQTWTLTSNMTFQSQGSYTWDTNAQATAVQSPLLTEQYVLIIHDSDADITAVPSAGYLGTFNQFRFGMYKSQDYQPLDQWNCATCNTNAAVPGLDKRAVGLAVSMSLVTLLSFTWFVTGLRVLW